MKTASISLIALFLFSCLPSCRNNYIEDSEFKFPDTFERSHIRINDWKCYVLTEFGYNEITPQGSFLQIESQINQEIPDYINFFEFEKISFPNESQAHVWADSMEADLNCYTISNLARIYLNADSTLFINYIYTFDTHELTQQAACYSYTYHFNGNSYHYETVELKDVNYGTSTSAWITDLRSTNLLLQAGDTIVVNFIEGVYK